MNNKNIFLIIFFSLFIILISNNALTTELTTPQQLFYEGNYNQAINHYETLLTNKNVSEKDLKNLSILYKENGDLNNAIKIYKKLLENYPKKEYEFYLGKSYFQIADYEKSFLYFKDLINLENKLIYNLENVSNEKFYYFLANLYLEMNNLNKAKNTFFKGIEENDKFHLNYLSLANLYNSKGNHDLAIKYYKKAINRDRNITHVYPIIAQNYEQIDDINSSYYYWQKSRSTNEKENLAQNKIEEFQTKYPYLKEEEVEKKKIERSQIEWISIDPVINEENIKNVRVGIVDNADKISFQSNENFNIIIDNKIINGKSNVEYTIERNNKNYHIYKEDKLISSLTSNSNLVIKSNTKDSLFLIYDINYGDGYFWASSEDRQYRGDFELYTVNDKNFNLINIVNMAEYLYSVVPAEMPALWPLEALKAQTVAARSYALKHLDRHIDKGYNLCDSVHCAAYNGVKSEHSRTYKAVNETSKEVAYYNSNIIDAVFSSNSGGYTESSKDVWGNENEYLSGVSTMINNDFQFPLDSYELNNWIKNSPTSYSKGDFASENSYRWVKVINEDYFKTKYNFDKLMEIKVLGRSKGGSVKSIEIVGIDKNNNIKSKIVNKDYIRSALTGLRSNRFIIDRIYNKDKSIKNIIIYGSGWGHNVGMDQTAAANMAEDNYNYNEIINYFYKDSKIYEYDLNK